MKLVTIYANHFGYRPALKTLADVPEASEKNDISETVVGFIHVY
jgi:hypothetical protein